MLLLLAFLLFLISTLWLDYKPIHLDTLKSDKINVLVRGAVIVEKELELDSKAVLQDALVQVEPTKEANVLALNPFQKLKDHDVITILEKQNECISINHANVEELIRLKGIGVETAKRIIKYRNENGLFQTLEQLQEVKGIGPSTFEKIKAYLCL